MKLCPRCGLNYIDDDEELCSCCAQDKNSAYGGQSKTSRTSIVTHRQNGPMVMSLGQIIPVSTNADLLNYLGYRTQNGEPFKAFMKSGMDISEDACIWMAHIDDISRSGWRNFFRGDKIIEQYDGRQPYPANFYDGLNDRKRVTFQKYSTCFVFRGVFRLEQYPDNLKCRILNRISDTYKF